MYGETGCGVRSVLTTSTLEMKHKKNCIPGEKGTLEFIVLWRVALTRFGG